MKIALIAWQKIFIVLICFAAAILGFMVKLPSGFRHIDKELHTAFYFMAAALLNVLFVQLKLVRHLLVFAALYLFGLAIEYTQQYSNRFFRRRIHGRFDPEDMQANLNGLLAFSVLWISCAVVVTLYRKTRKSAV